MIKDKLKDGKVLFYFKMVKDKGSKFDYYSISPKIRQIFYTGFMNWLKMMLIKKYEFFC